MLLWKHKKIWKKTNCHILVAENTMKAFTANQIKEGEKNDILHPHYFIIQNINLIPFYRCENRIYYNSSHSCSFQFIFFSISNPPHQKKTLCKDKIQHSTLTRWQKKKSFITNFNSKEPAKLLKIFVL
uniref:Uncharacterized protein n=1 Tax=Micrurus surinamensis TaxID=129470 RepID=A0A2D4Q019_MICSU